MLDIKFVRENPELVKAACKNKKVPVDIDLLLQLDEQKRRLGSALENLNQEKNQAAKSKDIERGRLVRDNLNKLEIEFKEAEQKFTALMLQLPNIPSADTPVGADERGNKILRQFGKIPQFDFEAKEHWQLGKSLDLIDSEKAADVSGSRFTYLKGDLALLEFALVQLVLQTVTSRQTIRQIIKDAKIKTSDKPFVAVVPPVFIKPEVMQRMGRLEPKEERYYIPSDELYLVGSAEHTLGPLHMDEIIAESELPIRYIGFSTAFRREAGSYGKDMKGILRLHQFDKLELESFTTADDSLAEQELFVAIQEYLLKQLQLPYQVVQICTGDMGGPDFRQIDIETWLPGQHKYRETHTSDNMTDFQSRRLNIRVKRQHSNKNELVHMNDATAIAIGRTLIAIMENYQQADGSIQIPKVLQQWLPGKTVIKSNGY